MNEPVDTSVNDLARDRDLVARVRARPGLYGLDGSYHPTVAFLIGLDLGRSGGLLAGFTPWLLAREGVESSLDWSALCLEEAFPGEGVRHWGGLTAERQRVASDLLLALLLEFLDERDGGAAP